MVVRLVTFSVSRECLEEYRRLLREQIGPVNREFGCIAIYALSERGHAGRHAIMSIWSDETRLTSMRNSERYGPVLGALRAVADGELEDRVFTGQER